MLVIGNKSLERMREKSIEYCQLKAATLAEEGQEVFMAAIFTLHAGKAVVQIAAVQVAVNNLLKI